MSYEPTPFEKLLTLMIYPTALGFVLGLLFGLLGLFGLFWLGLVLWFFLRLGLRLLGRFLSLFLSLERGGEPVLGRHFRCRIGV